jgi:hypothetical protein
MQFSCGKHQMHGVWGRAAPPTGSATGTLWVLSPLAELAHTLTTGSARGAAASHDLGRPVTGREHEGRSRLAKYTYPAGSTRGAAASHPSAPKWYTRAMH